MTTELKKLTATMAEIKRRYPSGGRRYSTIVENPFESGYWPLRKDWRKSLMEEHRDAVGKSAVGGTDVSDLKEAQWTRVLEALLLRAGKTSEDARRHKKGAEWKVRIAAELKRTTSASNPWIACALHMGRPNSVSQHLSWLRAKPTQP
jgi:hypothetical protein